MNSISSGEYLILKFKKLNKFKYLIFCMFYSYRPNNIVYSI